MKQIPPHATKEQCLNFIKNDMIHGCGGPFKVEIINNKINVQICDYI
jgi:hypothetical protein